MQNGIEYKTSNTNIINIDQENNELIDLNREYKDLSTDIVNKLFLETDTSMFNFLSLVYKTFENGIEYYKSLKLTYFILKHQQKKQPISDGKHLFIKR